MLLGGKYKTLDSHCVGNLKSLARIPYSLHEKDGICWPINLYGERMKLSGLEEFKEAAIPRDVFAEAVKKVKWLKAAERARLLFEMAREGSARELHRPYSWIEKLLTTPIPDGRKRTVWLILAPYLVNVKRLDDGQAELILREWLKRCNELYPVDRALLNKLKYFVRYARERRLKPLSLETLQKRYEELYRIFRPQLLK